MQSSRGFFLRHSFTQKESAATKLPNYLIPQQRILHTVRQRLPTRFDDVGAGPDGALAFVALARVDENPGGSGRSSH